MRQILCNLSRAILCLFTSLVMLPPAVAFAEPTQIGTSTSSQATYGASARKSFYDTLNRTHWAFWYNGVTISYAKSADGETLAILPGYFLKLRAFY